MQQTHIFTWKHIEKMCLDICRQLLLKNNQFDYIVAIGRGGSIPGAMISHFLNIPLNHLNISLRDFESMEHNTWMAEDAFGYNGTKRDILIVDDINDSGRTFEFLKHSWQDSCFPNVTTWDNIWHNNVQFASLVYNEVSLVNSDWYTKTINRTDDETWFVFPWENFWTIEE